MSNVNANDVEQGLKKILSLSKESANMTSDVLKEMMRTFLNGNADKTGKVSVRSLNKHAVENGGKLESVEISNQNIGDFLSVAKKYEINFALKHDSGAGIYHVMFEAKNTDDFKRAFTEYADKKQKDITQPERPVTTCKQLQQMAQKIQQEESKKKEKVREKSKNISL